jgi:hypothetical protein
MNNPYKVLNISQDATNAEIVKAQIPALREKKFSMKEITEAQACLRKPSTRIAADFTFPILDKEELKTISTSIKSMPIIFDSLDSNKFDSLK